MDGVLVDTERDWDGARRSVAEALGGEWSPNATTDMIGMSAPEWSAYMHDALGVDAEPAEINRRVVAEMLDRVGGGPPLLPGAAEAVRDLAARWPLGLASSANREVIDAVLDASGLASLFSATVSSEEVARGKPAPDVYLAAAEALGQRHPLGGRGRDAGRRAAERPLPAGRRGARAGRRSDRIARRARAPALAGVPAHRGRRGGRAPTRRAICLMDGGGRSQSDQRGAERRRSA